MTNLAKLILQVIFYLTQISGRAIEVHVSNLVEPVNSRKVRDLDTSHVHPLEESFRSCPGGNYHLLAGNLLKGDISQARVEGGVTIETIGGNHTRAALKLLYTKGLTDGLVLMTVYKDLDDLEALKIGYHHNQLASRSKTMNFLDYVQLVKKLVKEENPNLYKTLQNLFGLENKTKAKNKFKFHVKLAKMPEDIFQTISEIGQSWSGKKEFNQVTLRDCFYLPEDEIREAITMFKNEGQRAYKDYVNMKREKKTVSKKSGQTSEEPNLDEDYGELKERYEGLKDKYKGLEEKYQHLEEQIRKLKQGNGALKVEIETMRKEDKNSSKSATTQREQRDQHQPASAEPASKAAARVVRQKMPTKRKATANEDNSKKANVTAQHFQVGDKVWALYKADGVKYPAFIMAIDNDGYHVEFEEDGMKETLTQKDINPFIINKKQK